MKKPEKTPDTLIQGSDGRSYRRQPDGKLAEVFDPAAHADRLLDAITAKHTITGVRIVDPARPDDPAVVVTLHPDEAAPVIAAVRAVLAKRA